MHYIPLHQSKPLDKARAGIMRCFHSRLALSPPEKIAYFTPLPSRCILFFRFVKWIILENTLFL